MNCACIAASLAKWLLNGTQHPLQMLIYILQTPSFSGESGNWCGFGGKYLRRGWCAHHRRRTLHCKTTPCTQLQRILATFSDLLGFLGPGILIVSSVCISFHIIICRQLTWLLDTFPCHGFQGGPPKCFVPLHRNVLIQHRLTTVKHFCAPWNTSPS